MSGFTPLGGGSSKPNNPALTYEALGFSSGAGVTLTAGSANVLGSYATIGTTSNALCGFYIDVVNFSNTSARYQVNVRTGGSTVILSNYQIVPSLGSIRVRVPIAIATSTLVEMALRSSSATATCKAMIVGIIDSSTTAAGLSSATDLVGASTASTYAGTADVPISDTWTELVASSAATYSAILPVVSISPTANPTVGQSTGLIIGTGASSSEVQFGPSQIFTLSGTSPFAVLASLIPIEASISSGTRIAAKLTASNNATGDVLRVGLWGIN